MECTVSWTGNSGTRSGMGFIAETGSGHVVAMDGAPDERNPANGGQNLAARPMELLLIGLGGCASFDVVTILKKARQQVTDVRTELKAERADTIPAVFTTIHLHFVVTGKDLKESQVKKAVELSAEKYCSASAMLAAGGVKITHDFEIVQEA